MTKREKATEGLKCCVSVDKEGWPLCEKCPYAENGEGKLGTCESVRALMRDALEELEK